MNSGKPQIALESAPIMAYVLCGAHLTTTRKEVMPMAQYLADILVAVVAGVLVAFLVHLLRLNR